MARRPLAVALCGALLLLFVSPSVVGSEDAGGYQELALLQVSSSALPVLRSDAPEAELARTEASHVSAVAAAAAEQAAQKEKAAEVATAQVSEALRSLAVGEGAVKSATKQAAGKITDALDVLVGEAKDAVSAAQRAIAALEGEAQDADGRSTLARLEAARAESAALLEAVEAERAAVHRGGVAATPESMKLLQTGAGAKAKGPLPLEFLVAAVAFLITAHADLPATTTYCTWMLIIIIAAALNALVMVPMYMAVEDLRKGNPNKVPQGPPQNFDQLIRCGYLGSVDAVKESRAAVQALDRIPKSRPY